MFSNGSESDGSLGPVCYPAEMHILLPSLLREMAYFQCWVGITPTPPLGFIPEDLTQGGPVNFLLQRAKRFESHSGNFLLFLWKELSS